MTDYDFDKDTQEVFLNFLEDYKKINWENWLNISSITEYEEMALRNSGLDGVQNLAERIKKEKLEPKTFSVNLQRYVNEYNINDPLIMCHTSGTTNSNPEGLKWFHMQKSLVYNLWAPGMQAIFESSGLTSDSSAVIFVPSRMNFDGINENEGKKYVSLYTSEFSQRTVLAVIKPKSYLFSQYRYSKNLEVILDILSMDDIRVISAPAMTVLGWADLNKFRIGLEKSIQNIQENPSSIVLKYLDKIKLQGIDKIAGELQNKLSKKLKKATLIFGISSLNTEQWKLIRDFLNWKEGIDRFINLYVGSEFGPFASSLKLGSKEMYVFPLTLPVIEYKNNRDLISRTRAKRGNLLISRMDGLKPLININTDDTVSIINQDGLPKIDGKIIRAGFNLKYNINLSNQINLPAKFNVLAGDFFTFDKFEIIEPRNLLQCISSNCNVKTDALVLIKMVSDKEEWKLFVIKSEKGKCQNSEEISQTLYNCPQLENVEWVKNNDLVEIELINDQPVQFLKNREEILLKVRSGAIPKGILKKWPLYIVLPSQV